MKKILILAFIGLIFATFSYRSFLIDYFVEILMLLLYVFAGLVVLIISIYVKDRIAYYRLRKEMLKRVSAD